MKAITTLSDVHYLDRGIALYESLKRHTKVDFIIYYLCLDKVTYDTLKVIDDEQLVPLYIEDEFKDNKDFELLANNNNSVPNGFSTFHFALASFFTDYILEKETLELVLYVDADILFYHSVDVIFNSMKGSSVGIIKHRHIEVGSRFGGYNVGVVCFRNDYNGKACLKWWSNTQINPVNKWSKEYGTCGDQKYLELFEKLFEGIKVLDDDIGHGAPWNLPLYRYYKNPSVIYWEYKKQLLVFIHFARFTYTEDSYKEYRNKEWHLHLEDHPEIKRYYDEYYEILKDVKLRYKL